MERIYELINNIEGYLKQEIQLDAISKFDEAYQSITNLINEINESYLGKEVEPLKKSFIANFEKKFEALREDLINRSQTLVNKILETYEHLMTNATPKGIVLPKVNEIFKDIEKAKGKKWGKAGEPIFKSVLSDLKVKMEIDVVDQLETQFFDIKQHFGQVNKISQFVKSELNQIQDHILEIKQDSINLLESDEIKNKFINIIIPKLKNLLDYFKTNLLKIPENIKDNISALRQGPLELINNLKAEIKTCEERIIQLTTDLDAKAKNIDAINSEKEELTKIKTELEEKISSLTNKLTEKEKEIKELNASKEDLKLKMETEAGKKLGEKVSIYEEEIKILTQMLEKNPKFQLLHIISNLEETNLSEIKEQFKFDEIVIKTLLERLKEQNAIEISGEESNPTIKIKQKLNPLNFIDLGAQNDIINNFRQSINTSSFEENFEKVLSLINEYKDKDREKAGYILSILYLFIYKSKNFHLFNKIREIFKELRENSTYIRMMQNISEYTPWESRKIAILEGLAEMPKLKIFNSELGILDTSDENFPQDGPFQIKNIKFLSLIDWKDNIEAEKLTSNKFSNINDLTKYIWLNNKGSSFKISLINSSGKQYTIITSSSPKSVVELVMKQQKLVAE
ncbi:MAG: hypothetical protein ACTSO9_17395 [Candidatus Helarchaeota archaeon]